MAFLKVANRAISSLASGVDDAVTEWTLATGGGALFPTSGDFHVTCEDEIVKCTSRTGDVLTVTRHEEGTDAAAHASGKAVELRVTAGIIEELQDGIDDSLKIADLENPPTEDEATKAPTSEWAFDHDAATTGVHGAGSDYVAISKSATLPALNAPLGTSWENRTYAGWEIIDTATTYTIGSGQDFATLGACADALKGLILQAAVTIQLQEAIEITSTVTFNSMISAGGYIMIDLNGHDITINLNDEGIIFDGQFVAYVRDNAAAPKNSVIAKTGGDCDTGTWLLRWMNGATGNTCNVNLDANSETIASMLYVSNDARLLIISGTIFLDTGGGANYATCVDVRNAGTALARVKTAVGAGGDDFGIQSGGMAIDDAGHIHTEAGEFTP